MPLVVKNTTIADACVPSIIEDAQLFSTVTADPVGSDTERERKTKVKSSTANSESGEITPDLSETPNQVQDYGNHRNNLLPRPPRLQRK